MSQEAKEVMKYMIDEYYNPSASYQKAKNISNILYTSRSYISDVLGCSPREIYFTSGGTESNNWALKSLSDIGIKNGKNHIISTMIEHPSILNTLGYLETKGFKISLLKPDSNGLISLEDLSNEINENTIFATIMTANNEIGTIQKIKDIGKICHEKGIIFHTDAVQAVGHIPIDIYKDNVDLLSFSSHKFGGMKGCGGLICREDIDIDPMIYGGGQEYGKRSGTENTIGIITTSAALRESYTNIFSKSANKYVVQQKLINKIKTIPDVIVNADLLVDKLSNNINVSFKGISGQKLAILMSGDGILVSTASACSSGSSNRSHVLSAIGVPDEYINGTIRITFGDKVTSNEIDKIFNSIKNNVELLRRA